MKLNLALLVSATFAGKRSNKCDACDDLITRFNEWHQNPNMSCDRYVAPKFIAKGNLRGACKGDNHEQECKIQCKPSEEKCPGISELPAGWWHKTGKKAMNQYVLKAEQLQQARMKLKEARSLEKELAKYKKQQKKTAEQKAKAENKEFKKADWEAWREDKRAKNAAARAQRKQEKKERKAAAKALKELKKEERIAKRLLADQNKALFSFYASVEEHYDPLCPDLYLIEGLEEENALGRKYENFLRSKPNLA